MTSWHDADDEMQAELPVFETAPNDRVVGWTPLSNTEIAANHSRYLGWLEAARHKPAPESWDNRQMELA